MNRFELHRPAITDSGVTCSWTDGNSGLYRRQNFQFEIANASRIPERLWLLLAMMCLHSHWILLRPCRIELPHQLLPGERDLWIRLLQIEFQTLEGHRDQPDHDLDIELVEGKLILPAPVAIEDSNRCSTAFSGGRDSLAQAGLLLECSTRPLLVATTSPMPPLHDQSTTRRQEVFSALSSRADLLFREIHSDFRSSWDNAFAARKGYPVSVNAMTDTFLYTAAAVAASWLEGYPNVLLASESEVSDNATKDGHVVLFHHFMYSIPVQYGLSLLLKPWGIKHGSLICPLRGPQVQSMLCRRFPELARLQYSCWKVSEKESACSSCSKCLLTGFGILASDGNPAIVGLNVAKLMRYAALYKPRLVDPRDIGPLARNRVTYEHGMNIMRSIRDTRLSTFLRHCPGLLWHPSGWRTMVAYIRASRRSRRMNIPPPSGWRHAYGIFIPEVLREQILAIYQSMFTAADPASYETDFAGNRILVEYLKGYDIHESNDQYQQNE